MSKEDNLKLYKTLFNKNKEKFIELFTTDDGVLNDLEAAQKVYSLYNHWVYCDETLFVFDDKTGLWTTSEVVMCNIISRFNDNLYLLSINDKSEIKNYLKDMETQQHYKDKCYHNLKLYA